MSAKQENEGRQHRQSTELWQFVEKEKKMNNGLEVKVTRLHRLEGESSLRAFVDIYLNDALLLKGLRIVQGKNGLFVSMPRKQGTDKKWYETIQPISNETRDIPNYSGGI